MLADAAIRDIYGAHKFTKTAAEATAAALLAGCDINSGSQYAHYVDEALTAGLVNESMVDAALINAFKVSPSRILTLMSDSDI
eukprot:COSAG01_NODE_8995_length_2588_cov_2.266096_2_plen_83_part_00